MMNSLDVYEIYESNETLLESYIAFMTKYQSDMVPTKYYQESILKIGWLLFKAGTIVAIPFGLLFKLIGSIAYLIGSVARGVNYTAPQIATGIKWTANFLRGAISQWKAILTSIGVVGVGAFLYKIYDLIKKLTEHKSKNIAGEFIKSTTNIIGKTGKTIKDKFITLSKNVKMSSTDKQQILHSFVGIKKLVNVGIGVGATIALVFATLYMYKKINGIIGRSNNMKPDQVVKKLDAIKQDYKRVVEKSKRDTISKTKNIRRILYGK